MRLFGYDVYGGGDNFVEPIEPQQAPRRDEPSFSKNQRPSGMFNRIVWYCNQWTPFPTDIPVYLRVRPGTANPVVDVRVQQSQRTTGGLTRVPPPSYSEQVMGH